MKNQELAAELALYLYMALKTTLIGNIRLTDLRIKAQELLAIISNAEAEERNYEHKI